MICLLTGATGFLGKRVLSLLVRDSRISRIHVVSRRRKTHPDPRVRFIRADLSEPWSSNRLLEDVDTVIHLAGLYDFGTSFSRNYQQNVLPVVNMIDRIREIPQINRPRIFFASTYAVGYGAHSTLEEIPLTELPTIRHSYAYTKAVAEKALSDSGLTAKIFRLGVLVGDTASGEIEKFDGPYYLMRFLAQMSKSSLLSRLTRLPLPCSPEGVLPLVPVDEAARVFHKALFMEFPTSRPCEFYGVFNTRSERIGRFVETAISEYIPSCRPIYFSRSPSPLLGKLQHRVTGIPQDAFDFVTRPVRLGNTDFQTVFGSESITPFQSYQKIFFEGFRNAYF